MTDLIVVPQQNQWHKLKALVLDSAVRCRRIFQGMGAGGKDGAIRHVMSGVNPQVLPGFRDWEVGKSSSSLNSHGAAGKVAASRMSAPTRRESAV